MNTRPPKVSVLLPVYNAEKFLRKTIESILAQSFRDFELILINDGSTDQSENVMREFSDPRLVIVNNEENLKLIATLNRGIALARGAYLARCDADDIYAPDRFEKQVRYLDAHPDISVLGTDAWYINEADVVTGTTRFFPSKPADVLARLFTSSPVFHPSVMMRTEALRAVGGYSANAVHAEDYALWLAFSKDGYGLANLPEKLLFYRVHPQSISQSKMTEQARTTEALLEQFYSNALGENAGAGFRAPANLAEFKKIFMRRKFSGAEASMALLKEDVWFQFRKRIASPAAPGSFAALGALFVRRPSIMLWFLKNVLRYAKDSLLVRSKKRFPADLYW